ncbi:hypothetical protein, partial [Parachlamydia acanthamoebae]
MNDFLTPLEKQFQKIKNRLSESFFQKVITQPNRPAVISLQEVQSSNPHVLDILQQGKYTIMRASENSDTAIAIETQHFEECKPLNLSAYAQQLDDNVAVYAKNKETKEAFIFLSVHIPGYELEFPRENLKDHITSSENKLESVFDVVNTLQMCISKLKEKYPDANVIIQGDFNTYPEYFNSDLNPEISEKIERLNIFSHLEQKQDLEVYRTDKPTELNRQAHELQERELDYVLASKSLKGRVHMFEPDDQELSLANLAKDTVHFDPMLLFSDH